MPAILKFGNMESQKRPRSEDNDNDTSVSKKFPRIAIPIRSETKEAVKLLLSERKKKAERVEMKKFEEIRVIQAAQYCVFFHPERRVSMTQLAAFSLFATCLLLLAITNFKFLFTEQLPKARLTLKVSQS